MFVLRNLENEDITIVKKWLEKEYVAKWFGDSSEWLFEINHRMDKFDFIKHFIVEENSVPVGFCQYYDWNRAFEEQEFSKPIGTYGIDYMFGEERLLGKGLGKELVKLICDKVVVDHSDAFQIVADPTIEEERINLASIKVLLANGFHYDEEALVYKKRLNI